VSVLLKTADANLHRKGCPILAPVAGLESDRLPGDHALLQTLDGYIIESNVKIAFMFADQFFAAVGQTITGLAVDVENGPILVEQQEGVSRVIHEGTEAPLARAQLPLRLFQLRDIVQNAKLAQSPPRSVPGDITLTVDHAQGAVRTHHPIFHVVPRSAGA
jgi:hypothetical protein